MSLPVPLLLSALLCLVAAAAPAQGGAPAGPGAIRGVVQSEAGAPLDAATVEVRSTADSSVAGRALTGADGAFRVGGLAHGRYRVEVSRPGFARQVRRDVAVTAAAPVAELGTLRLAAAAVVLEGLEVRTERAAVAVAPDRTLYSTRDMPVAAGGTATDVLRSVPELDVDVNGRVSLRGSTGVTIHVNGRPAPVRGEALTTFLQQFPASRIERIEVIPNPSARYDPDGTAGIVNIVLKENLDLGLSGSVSLNAGTRGSTGGSGRVAYQRGPFTLFGGTSLNVSRRSSTGSDLRQNLAARPVTYLQQEFRSRNRGSFGMLDLSVELKLGKRATLWSSASGYFNGSDSDGTTAYLHMDSVRAPTERYDRVTSSEWTGSSADAGLGLRYTLQPQRHELTVELRRNGGVNRSDGRFVRESLTLEGDPADLPQELTVNRSDEENGEVTLQADYSRPLGTEGKLEVGYRGTLRSTEDDDRVDVFARDGAASPDRTTRSAYDYREDFHSVYLTLGRKLGALGLQAGVRAEQAATSFRLPDTGKSFDNEYASIFPSANLSYDFGRGKQARLNYSKRIERPWPFFLNPYVPSADPLNRSVGNPSLRPKYTHSLSTDLSWTGPMGTLRVSPYYRRTVDNWEQIRRVDSAGVATMTWENLASLESYGTTLSASLRSTGRVGGSASLSGYRELRDASNLSLDYSSDALRWSANANATLRVTERLNLQSMVRYNPPRDVPQGRHSSSLMTSFGARQQLWKNRGWLNFSVTDPFNLWRTSFESRDRTYVQTGRNRWTMRMATLSFTYSFGRPPQETRRRSPENPAPSQQPEGAPPVP